MIMRKMSLLLVAGMMTGIALVALAEQQAAPQNPPGAQIQSTPSAGVPLGRIVVINASAFYSPEEGIQQLVQQMKRVDDMFKDRRAELEALAQRVDSLQREIETQGPNLTPQARADKQEALEQLQRELQRKREDGDRDYQRAMRDATGPVQERIRAFFESYAKSRGIMIVLEAANLAQTGGLAYVDPQADITRDFISEYNKANPVAASSTPASQTQPATTGQPKSSAPPKSGTRKP